jgi:plasmid recombination enzyme
MGKTMSYHISTGKHSILTRNDFKRIESHNWRKYKDGKDDTGIIELKNGELEGKSMLERFNYVLDKEISENIFDYNSRQKRADRKIYGIDDYINKMESSKLPQNLAVEIIVQPCDREYWIENRDKRGKMNDIFKEYLNFMETGMMKDFKVISATVHQDEDSPHLHVVGIPIADTNKPPKKGISKGRVFTKKSLEFQQDQTRKFFEDNMKKYIDKDFSFDEKTTGRNRDLTVDEYKELKTSFNKENFVKIEKAKEELNSNLESLDKSFEHIDLFDLKNRKKIEKVQPVKESLERLINTYRESVKEIRRDMDSIIEDYGNVRLDDSNKAFLEKNLKRNFKKELGDKLRAEFMATKEYQDFKDRVLQDSRTALINKTERLLTQKKVIEELEKERQAKAESIKALEDEKFELVKEINSLYDEKNSLKTNIESLKDEKDSVKNEIKELKGIIESNNYKQLAEKITRSRKEIQDLDSDILKKRKTAGDMEKEIQELEKKNGLLNREFEKIELETRETKKKNLKEMEDLISRRKELDNTIKEYEEIVKKGDYSEIITKYKKAQSNYTQIKAEVDNLNTQATARRKELNDMELGMKEYKESQRKLQESVNNLKEEKKELDNSLLVSQAKQDYIFLAEEFINTQVNKWKKRRGKECNENGFEEETDSLIKDHLTPSMIDTLMLIAREPDNLYSKAYSDFDNTMDSLFNSNRNKAIDYGFDY